MAVDPLILVSNPGSASRKYALFRGKKSLAQLHFEYDADKVVCSVFFDDQKHQTKIDASSIDQSVDYLIPILKEYEILPDDEKIGHIGLRIVAPSSFFLEHRVMNDETVKRLEKILPHAPLHIEATLQEFHSLKTRFPHTTIFGASDSAFHATKPDYAWNYGLPLGDADRFEIKRFGYHGLSFASAVRNLRSSDRIPPRLIICHLGSGASVAAIWHGKSHDTTMGYSPLEGLIMATRSGTIDVVAAQVLKTELGLDDLGLQEYLNKKSGLLGLSGKSSDIREVLKLEEDGNHHAKLALQTYVYNVQKAIGQMSAALGGADMLVFTGTVGERSAPMRTRITEALGYMDFVIDSKSNEKCIGPEAPICISRLAQSKPIFVVPADEAQEIANIIHAKYA